MSAESVSETTASQGPRRLLANTIRERWQYLPLVIAAVYAIVLLVHLGAVVRTIDQDADAISPNQLAKLISSHHGTVVLGDSAWYSTLLFEVVTRWLPFYRALWDLAPFVATASCFATIVWSAWRVAGRWAAAITCALLLCADATTLTSLGELNDHVLTWLSDGLLIGGLVWVLHRAQPVRRSRWLAVAIVLGLFVSVNLASDPLLYAGGIAPTLAGAAFAWWRSPSAVTRQGALYAAVVSAIAIVGSAVVVHVMHQHHIISNPGWTYAFAPPGAISGNFGLWWQSLGLLGGNFYGKSVTLMPLIYLAGAALTVAMVFLIPRVAQLELRDGSSRDAHAGAGSAAAHAHTPARAAYVVAWSLSALFVSTAFIVSSLPVALGTARYLVGVTMAAAALAPLLARSRGATALVVAAASAYCISGIVSIAHGEASQVAGVTQADADMFARLARTEHVDHGYTGYWDASPITWKSRFRVLAYPASECGTGICTPFLSYISAWYQPHGKERTFLITDSAQPYMQNAPASLGRPVASFPVGGTFTFLVYDYDIASRIQ